MSDTIKETKNTLPNYPLLSEQLLLVAKEFHSCESVLNNIKKIKDKRTFRKAYENTYEEVAQKFDISIDNDDDDDINELEDKISELEDEIYDLYHQYGKNESILDEFKIRHFVQHKNDYTEPEIEILLKFGKIILNQLNPHKSEKNITMSDKYILIGKTPKKTNHILEWARWFENNNAIVGQHTINGVRVSTVFLGIDHNFNPTLTGQKEPLIFETMIFGGKHDSYCERYSTWSQAEEGHKKALELIKPNFITRILERMAKWWDTTL